MSSIVRRPDDDAAETRAVQARTVSGPAGLWFTKPPGVLRAIAVFAAVRLAGLAVVAAFDHAVGRSLSKSLSHSWDSKWYLSIAQHGYGHHSRETAAGLLQTDWAFFPLYPALIRAVATVLRLSVDQAALVVAWTAALAAAYGVYAVAHHVHGVAVATVTVALWAMLPHSVVLTLAYTEPLFCALAAWCLYALLTSHWPAAGALAALAGLTRPSGYALAATVLVVALHQVVRRRGRVPAGLWAGALLAPVGWVGYVLWVGSRTGDVPHGYLKVQSAWNSRFDFGVQELDFLRGLFLNGGKVGYPLALVIVVVSVLLFVLLCLDRAPLALVVYAGALVTLVVLASGPFASKPRFLLPAFPLLIPVARAMVRGWWARRGQVLAVAGMLTAVSLTYGAYLVVLGKQPL
ncbi:mannosyltransferase family protein [Streptomyces sp. NPDC102467]|uniref:mannosyltransferase family protein n=1 Tax=Streptomyces sp. NPDC102467 TaxID=3366179 RepID=UPI00382A8329